MVDRWDQTPNLPNATLTLYHWTTAARQKYEKIDSTGDKKGREAERVKVCLKERLWGTKYWSNVYENISYDLYDCVLHNKSWVTTSIFLQLYRYIIRWP